MDETPPNGEGDQPGGDTAVPAEIEAARVDAYTPAADPEAMRAEEAPQPMALVASRDEHREKSDDADA